MIVRALGMQALAVLSRLDGEEIKIFQEYLGSSDRTEWGQLGYVSHLEEHHVDFVPSCSEHHLTRVFLVIGHLVEWVP